MINKNLQKYWTSLEKKYSPPKYVKKIKDLEFKELKDAVDKKKEKYLKKIIRRMYVNKEAYILKNAAPKNFKKIVIKIADSYKKIESLASIKC